VTNEVKGNKERQALSLTVQATLQGDDPNRPKMAAYVFNGAGQPLGQAALDEKGQAVIRLPEQASGDSLRVLVGPDFEGRLGEKAISYDQLNRFDAAEKRVFFNRDKFEAVVKFDISDLIWKCWFPHWCLVRGKVIKRIFVNGIAVDLPICDAKVRIYEVDPIYRIIPLLPDDILDRIRQELLKPRPPVIVNPNPPDPPPFEKLFQQLDATRLVSTQLAGAHTSEMMENQALSVRLGQTSALVPAELASQLSLASGAQLRKLLLDNVKLIKPWLCWWPWWIYYSTQLLAEVEPDDEGNFQAIIFLGCGFFYDQPDLYFTVEQELSGTPTLVYDPPLPCNTYWDYVCGTPVTLIVTDPRAIPCHSDPLLPDGGVSILSVGKKSLVDIYGSGATPVTAADKGLLKTDIHTGYSNAPFGGNVGLVVDFGSSLRFRPNPAVPQYYYRWSYRQLDSALNPIGPWTHLTQTVEWHYRFKVGTDILYPTYKFGPKVVGPNINLFEVPPIVSPDGDPTHYWVVLNEEVDRPSAYFDTRTAPPGTVLALPIAGKVELRLEIFDHTGTKIVNPGAHGIDFRLPRVGLASSSTFIGTVHTDPAGPANLTVANPATLTDTGDFYFTLHFDNNGTTALIDAPSIPSGVTDPCGFLRYHTGNETVTINYHAHHPHAHAVYTFQMVKGSPPPSHTESGEVGLPGDFTVTWGPNGWVPGAPAGLPHSPSVNELLDGCTEAAYNMNLWVYGKATNGWARLGYDAFFPRAFALAKHP
jgi:hypothetical protein